jgi:hypothetical protein
MANRISLLSALLHVIHVAHAQNDTVDNLRYVDQLIGSANGGSSQLSFPQTHC